MDVVVRREAEQERPPHSKTDSQNTLANEYMPLWIEAIKLAPHFVWLLATILALWWFYSPVIKYLERNPVTKFGIGVLQIEFAQKELAKAAKEKDQKIPLELGDRIDRSAAVLKDATILWLDDNPKNNTSVRRALTSLGVIVDLATSSEEALRMVNSASYGLIISDLHRKEKSTSDCFPPEIPFQPRNAGCFFLQKAKEVYDGKRQRLVPIVFYGAFVDPEWGTPPYAFGATAQVSELLHLILDGLERRKSDR